MLNSMTGFGRGEASNSDVTVVVELKSVNNRFRDIQLRAPREYMALEPRINRQMKACFARGRIDAFVRRTTRAGRQRIVADMELASNYQAVVNQVAEQMVGFVKPEVPFQFILNQPGVLRIEEVEVDVMAEWPVIETALQVALDDLTQMRKSEGAALHADLAGMLEEVQLSVGQIEAATVGINDRLRERLENRIRRMVGDRFDPHRITQEVAILVDKADVSEEITRLRSHSSQFGDALQKGEPVGRRLDFLLQEMNREVNTIGSKATDLPVHQKVVDLKSTLERMREQSANVE